MTNASRFKMSQDRLDALKEELNYLETVREKTANMTRPRPSRASSIPRSPS